VLLNLTRRWGWNICIALLTLIVFSLGTMDSNAALASATIMSRTAAIAPTLSAQPKGLGPVCADRSAWETTAIAYKASPIIEKAEALLDKPFPKWSSAAYLDYSQTGQRQTGEQMLDARIQWIYPLVLAECVEAQGRFLPRLEEVLNELVEQPSWMLPSSDKSTDMSRDRTDEVDLLSADLAHTLAETLYLLGDKLTAETRSNVFSAIEKRVLEPVRNSILTGKGNSWLSREDNWNAVCLKGTVAAAVTILPKAEDRAFFIASAEYYIHNYLASFNQEGYTAEGPTYWNYGFSHFAQLREILTQATSGQVELFSDPKVYNMAQYGSAIALPNNAAPPFGDTNYDEQIDTRTLAYVNRAFDPKVPDSFAKEWLPLNPGTNASPLVDAVITLFNEATPISNSPAHTSQVSSGLHSYFESVGVLISRPDTVTDHTLGFAIKAGGNGTKAISHSHNDIGSYTIALGKEKPSGDPGRTAYSERTFSEDRYTIPGINSYGHPVPKVAGKLQRTATEVNPKVLETQFSSQFDEIEIDLTSAYEVESLQSLVRTAHYSRSESQSIEITDQFEFTQPESFEVPLITVGNFKRNTDGSVEFWQSGDHLSAKIEASSAYELAEEKISEEGLTFTRLAIRLTEPQQSGQIKVRFVAI
jgi:hypothetical protein